MKHLDDRTMANLDVVLEETCRGFPHGGDHALRKKVAQKLLKSAQKGNTTLSALEKIARMAVPKRRRAD
jgi:hypothetical protein